MKKPIAIKDLGVDEITGLKKTIEVFQININSDTEVINVEYRINYLAPKNNEVVKVENSGYTRYNRPEVFEKQLIDNEYVSVKIKESKFKFDELRNSQVGKMIEGMINLDLEEYPNLLQD